MTPVTDTILCGDVLEKLKELPDGCVQCVVTSPPYWGLRDYGTNGQIGVEETPEAYVLRLVEVFREIRRVLKKDGTLWLNLGDTYSAARWSSGTGQPMNKFKDIHRTGQITTVRKSGLPDKNLVGIPWRVAFALQDDGWYLRSDIIWAKPNPMPESVTDRPTRSHEYLFLLSKSKQYYYDADAIKEPPAIVSLKRISQKNFDNQQGGIKDYINGTNPNRSMRKTIDHFKESVKRKQDLVDNNTYTGFNDRYVAVPSVNKRSVWFIPTHPYPEAHFATFPEALIEPCIKAGSRQDDIVLDPFIGSGTTGLVAKKLGRNYIGIELNPKYVRLAERRIRPYLNHKLATFVLAEPEEEAGR